MKAISVKQPFAWALVTDIEGSLIGDKAVSGMPWSTDHRGPLLIASSRKEESQEDRETLELLIGMPIPSDDPYLQRGVILGVVDVISGSDGVAILSDVRRLPPTITSSRIGMYDLKTVDGIPVDIWIEREAVNNGTE